jgi:DNA-binding transcriptional ArsR family regulator
MTGTKITQIRLRECSNTMVGEVLMAEQVLTVLPAADREPAGPPADPAAARALLPAAADGVELMAKFFRALGDRARLRLLEFLLPAEHTVTECVRHIGLSQGRVSAHLACLADCGYVQVRRSGRFAWYKVADPRVADLIMLARSLAADNATELADCVRIPPAPSMQP